MSPKVSVLMCVYNSNKHYWLNIAIQSILTQSFGELEFIIVDDCSTDDSVQIIKDYAKNDSRIKLFHTHENVGLTKALNIGLNKCKGEFIVRQDADDVSHPFKIEKQLGMIEKHSSLGIVGCWYEHIDEDGKVFHKCQANPEDLPDTHVAGSVAGGSPLIKWEVIEKLDIKTFPHYNRIGLRNWVLIEHNSLIFESILNFMSQSNLCFDEVIKNNFANTNDIAIIFESKNEDNIYLRVILGPYQKNERIKYFTFEPSVNEGLILDVDIWEENISIPGFNLLELTKKYQSILFSLCQNIFTKLLERMKKDE